MPSGLIEDENGVSTGGDFGCDFVEVKLHGLGVAGRQHEGCASLQRDNEAASGASIKMRMPEAWNAGRA